MQANKRFIDMKIQTRSVKSGKREKKQMLNRLELKIIQKKCIVYTFYYIVLHQRKWCHIIISSK